jgi:hypothetical protein
MSNNIYTVVQIVVENNGVEPMTLPITRDALAVELILLYFKFHLYRCTNISGEYRSRTDDPLRARQVL